MDPDGITNEFLRLYLRDQDAGEVGPLRRYQERFCGHEDTVAAEYERLQRDLEPGPPVAQPGAGPAAIGPYAILGVLGEGGMGTVYLAEQQRPVMRRVALKVVRLGLVTDEVLARFETERQALALMEHDNIAKIFDAGSTDTGQPYFVMEHVDGTPITEHCDRERISVRRRLALFQQVCAGVQHAHQKGVIHRDLKPTNVLVTVQDGRAVPKIIDFGVARATRPGRGGARATLLTQRGQVVGTPEYMSPEQAGPSSEDLDTRTDIYALGVMLYELLVGQLPFSSADLRRADIDEVERTIREVEPPRPSARLGGGADAEGAARGRSTTPTALARELRGELDWIVMRTIEKDRERRYATASELAGDIGRFLADEPVLAGPPSAAYRLRKLARRYRAQVTAAALVLAALAVGLVVSVVFYRQAVANQRLEQAARERAQRNFERARAAVDAMLTAVGAERLRELPWMEPVRRQLLEQAVAFHEGFLAEAGGDDAVRAETAATHDRLGSIELLLGRFDSAERSYRQSLALLAELIGADAAEPGHGLAHAAAERHLAQVLRRTGRGSEAEASSRRAIAELSALGDDDGARQALAGAWHDVGVLLQSVAPERAQDAYARAVGILRSLAGQVGDAGVQERLGEALTDRGSGLVASHRYREAETDFVEARDLLEQAAAAHPDAQEPRASLARAELALLSLWDETQRTRQAVDDFPRVIERLKRLADDFPHTLEHSDWLAGAYNNFAVALFRVGRRDEQHRMIEAAVSVYEPLVARCPKVPAFRLELARTLINLGKTTPDAAGAVTTLRRAVGLLEQVHREQPDDALPWTLLVSGCLFLSEQLAEQEQWNDAEASANRALEVGEALCAHVDDPTPYREELTNVHLQLHALALRRDDQAAARAHLLAAFETQCECQRAEPDNQFLSGYTEHVFGLLVGFLLEHEVHAAAAEQAEAYAALFEADGPRTFEAACVLGRCCALADPDSALRAGYEQRATALLRASSERGFRDAERARTEESLAALRGRPGFEDWLRELAPR